MSGTAGHTGRRFLLAALLFAAALPYFVNLGATSIIDANEAFYTETPREMIEAGDYVNPTFNYEPRFNKPPLSYWVVAASYRLFGVSLSAARLPIAFGAVVMMVTVFLIGRRIFSVRAGLLASLTLAASPRLVGFSRRIIIDVYTAMFMGLVLLFFVLAETADARNDQRRRRHWLVCMYVAIGLGVLTKGPVVMVLPALVFTVYLAAVNRLAALRAMMLPVGAIIVAVIVTPFYFELYRQHGWDYISSFLLRENFARYAEGLGTPGRGPLFYLPVVFADLFFPWSLLLPVALALVPWSRLAGTRKAVARDRDSDLRLLLGIWIAVIVGFFTLSRTKQDLYVLPFVAAGAPLVGGLLDRVCELRFARIDAAARWSVGVLAVLLAVLGGGALWLFWHGWSLELTSVGPLGLVILAGGVAALIASVRGKAYAAALVLVASVVLANWITVVWTFKEFERYKPVPQLARVIAQTGEPEARVATYNLGVPSLVFYLRRHVTELTTAQELNQFFAADDRAFCLMYEDVFKELQAGLLAPVRVVATAPTVLGRPADFLRGRPFRYVVLLTNRVGTP